MDRGGCEEEDEFHQKSSRSPWRDQIGAKNRKMPPEQVPRADFRWPQSR